MIATSRNIRQGLKLKSRILANGKPASTGKAGSNGHRNGNGNGHTSNRIATGSNGNGKPNKSRNSGPCAAEVELKLQQWESAKAAAKALYAEADALEQQIILSLGVGGSLSLSDGRRLAVDDNFLDKTGAVKIKAFSVCGVKRFEISVK